MSELTLDEYLAEENVIECPKSSIKETLNKKKILNKKTVNQIIRHKEVEQRGKNIVIKL